MLGVTQEKSTLSFSVGSAVVVGGSTGSCRGAQPGDLTH